MLQITLDYVPPAILRGNSTAQSWHAKAKAKKDMRENGWAYGLELKQQNPDIEFPLQGSIALCVDMWTPRRIDADNLLYGMKHFTDGLEEASHRHVGAGVFKNDNQIRAMFIRTHKGVSKTMLTIYRADEKLSGLRLVCGCEGECIIGL